MRSDDVQSVAGNFLSGAKGEIVEVECISNDYGEKEMEREKWNWAEIATRILCITGLSPTC
jgi:hypothetical protein